MKRAGHPGRIGPLRADIYLGLLDGRWQHHTRDQIITDLLTRTIDDGVGPDDVVDPDDIAGPGGAVDPDDPSDPAGLAHPTDPPVDGDVPAGGALAESGAGTHRDGVAPADGPDTVSEGTVSERPALPARRVGVEVRVGLSTLLGHDRHPGEVAGWGAITAEVARTLVIVQRGAEWRYALTDSAGRLMLAGITRRRPHHSAPASELPPCRGGSVELQLPVAVLTELAADLEACGEWAAVVTDLAAQYTRHRESGRRGPTGQDPTARFAGAALRRHVQIRDRACVYPGCRCTARSADLDHTIDHGYGGLTTVGNSGPLCRHDHRLKHVGRWRLHQPEPGHFTWTSPLGRTYRTQPPPITIDLPDPRPRPGHLEDLLITTPDDDQPILDRPPPRPDPPPAGPPDPDEPPPF